MFSIRKYANLQLVYLALSVVRLARFATASAMSFVLCCIALHCVALYRTLVFIMSSHVSFYHFVLSCCFYPFATTLRLFACCYLAAFPT
jgi:hypothetical protein